MMAIGLMNTFHMGEVMNLEGINIQRPRLNRLTLSKCPSQNLNPLEAGQ